MINYFNFKKLNGQYLLTNDFGKYAFLTPNDFHELITNGAVTDNKLNDELCRKKFVYTSSLKSFVDNNTYLMNDAKEYLFHPTTIYLWLISLAASKELSILLLKLLKCKSNRYSDFILGLRARTAVC